MTVRLRSPIKAFTNVLLFEALAAGIGFWMVVLLIIVLMKLGY